MKRLAMDPRVPRPDGIRCMDGMDPASSGVWVSMGKKAIKAEKQKHFLPFQINDELLKSAPRTARSPLPPHCGEEITDSVMDNLEGEPELRIRRTACTRKKAVLWQR